MDNATSSSTQIPQPSSYENPTLRKVEPYWSALRTYVKGRWMDREILEVLSTEFRDRSVEYYRYALSAGITRVNGKTVYEGYILRNGDYFDGGQGGLPVLPSSTKVDQKSHQQESNQVSETDSKPIESESTEEPNKSSIRTSNDLSIALSTKAPDAYDSTPNAELDNQISSSLSNDFPTIEGGGTPITATSTPAALEEPQASPPEDTPLESHINMIDPDVISSLFESMPPNKHRPPKNRNRSQNSNKPKQKPSAVGKRAPRFTPPSRTDNPGDQDLLPREDGTDVGAASPVPLSEETLQVIKALRNKKDESEEFSRWKDVVFKTKAFVKTQGVNSVSATMRNQVPRHIREQRQEEASKMAPIDSSHLSNEGNLLSQNSESPAAVVVGESFSYCEECFLPVYPDPKPSQLYICLHALRYTTSKWSFATEMPFWATPGWVPEDT
ncbi:hypothetical protein FRC03_012816 [Tulasnella sp. 419]|nr:hypothetical protein FRC03_012816 [Tulasnella sp. 419]